MNWNAKLATLGLRTIAGYVGTKVMEPVSSALYDLEPAAARQQEDAARPGDPYDIAAQKTAALFGMTLSDAQQKMLGLVFHYGLGLGWGVTYPLLRRYTALGPVAAGLLSGVTMSLLVDEGLTPALGFSAPNAAYPLATHARGFVAHLAYGLSVAAAAETLVWLGRTAQEHP